MGTCPLLCAHSSNFPLRGGKGRQWEAGISEPFYIKAPGGVKAGSTTAVPVSGIDWYPTLLELAGVELPEEQDIDGVSLVPLLKGESIEDRALYWHYPHYGNQGGEPSSIIMQGDWKLIHYHEDGRNEPYNIATDIGEENDLAKSHSKRVESMCAQLSNWMESTGATMPTPDPQFDPAKRAARWEMLKTRGMDALEKRHAVYLDRNYEPNQDWWGSVPKN